MDQAEAPGSLSEALDVHPAPARPAAPAEPAPPPARRTWLGLRCRSPARRSSPCTPWQGLAIDQATASSTQYEALEVGYSCLSPSPAPRHPAPAYALAPCVLIETGSSGA